MPVPGRNRRTPEPDGSSADQRVLPHLPEATNKVRCVCVCLSTGEAGEEQHGVQEQEELPEGGGWRGYGMGQNTSI